MLVGGTLAGLIGPQAVTYFSLAYIGSVASGIQWGSGNYSAGIVMNIPQDDIICTGIKIYTNYPGGGTRNLKFSVFDSFGNLIITETEASVPNQTLHTHTFASPVTIVGHQRQGTAGLQGYKFTVWETSGTYYPSMSGLENGVAGLPAGPLLFYKNNNAIAFAKGFGYIPGPTGVINYAYAINGGEFYPIEPVFT